MAGRSAPLPAVLVLACGLPAAAIADPYGVGDRLFVATPTTDDPFAVDEAAFTATGFPRPAAGVPATRETDLNLEVDKRLFDRLAVGIQGTYTLLETPGAPGAYGFDNVEAHVKDELYVDEDHELVASVGVEREFGGTGARRVGADAIGTTTPTVYLGKGLGDLPDGLRYLRPIEVTATLAYAVSDEATRTSLVVDPADGARTLGLVHVPGQLQAGLAIGYSFRYLQGNVEYLGLPRLIGRLTPVVEFTYATPVGRAYGTAPTGVVAPGLVYSDIGFDLGAEALLPLTGATASGPGFVMALTVFFGDS